MCASMFINTVCQSHQPQKKKNNPAQCQNGTCPHLPGCDNYPAFYTICKGFPKRVTGKSGAKALVPCPQFSVSLKVNRKETLVKKHRKGKKADQVQVDTSQDLPSDELFLGAVEWGIDNDTHSDDVIVGDINALCTNEAYTSVWLCTSTRSKDTASLCMNVNIRIGVYVLPLCIFKCIYSNCIGSTKQSHSLDTSDTRLTA